MDHTPPPLQQQRQCRVQPQCQYQWWGQGHRHTQGQEQPMHLQRPSVQGHKRRLSQARRHTQPPLQQRMLLPLPLAPVKQQQRQAA